MIWGRRVLRRQGVRVSHIVVSQARVRVRAIARVRDRVEGLVPVPHCMKGFQPQECPMRLRFRDGDELPCTVSGWA